MMKYSYATNLGAAIVLLVPAIALQSGGARSLEESLKDTVDSLAQLTTIEKRLGAKDPDAIAEILKITEPPIADDKTRERARDVLRDTINQLQAELDAVDPSANPKLVADDGPPKSSAHASGSKPSASETAPGGAHAATRASFEPAGYVADAIKLARTYYKQDKFELALAVLGETSDDADAGYWKARCLEKLGRDEEARTTYRHVVEITQGHDADRAKEALEFLEWRLKFDHAKTTAPAKKTP